MSSGGRRRGPARWFLEGDSWPEELDWGSIEPGQLEIVGDNLAGTNARRIGPFLERYGSLISHLSLESRYLGQEARIDLSVLDLAKLCPNLTRLWLQGVVVSNQVWMAPKLMKLHLQECTITTPDDLRLGEDISGPGVALEEVALYQCHWPAGSLHWGAYSGLRDFDYRLDDTAENAFPQRFTFRDCGELSKLTVQIMNTFELGLSGRMPQLEVVRLDAGESHDSVLQTDELQDCTFDAICRYYC